MQAIRHGTMLPSLQQNEIGTSELDPFRSSILGPVVSPVNASRRPSRDAAHHSGSGRMANPYSMGDFHLLFFASFPGALCSGSLALPPRIQAASVCNLDQSRGRPRYGTRRRAALPHSHSGRLGAISTWAVIVGFRLSRIMCLLFRIC
jgi:hypothetical protein